MPSCVVGLWLFLAGCEASGRPLRSVSRIFRPGPRLGDAKIHRLSSIRGIGSTRKGIRHEAARKDGWMVSAFREGPEHVSASSAHACFTPSELDLIDRLFSVVGVEADRKSRSIHGYMEQRLQEANNLPQIKLLRDALQSTSAQVDDDFAIDKTSWYDAFARLKSRADEGMLGYRTDKGSFLRFNFKNFLQTNYLRLHPPWQRQIMQAAASGHLSVVKDLLASGDVNAKDAYGSTVLIHAAANGHRELVRYLAKHTNADVDAQDSENGCTALWRAAERGHLDLVRFLFDEAGADVEARDKSGRTALIASAENGHVDVVRYLIEQANANLESEDDSGATALARGSLEAVRYLVEEIKADINARMERCKGGLTVLEYATRYRSDDAATDYLKVVFTKPHAQPAHSVSYT
uniref:Uncharacterized protein n=2 Tax=Lotharella globosa TaxID=91324 RepID=A0A7S3Z2E0_9EUKA